MQAADEGPEKLGLDDTLRGLRETGVYTYALFTPA